MDLPHDKIILHNCQFLTTIGITEEERKVKRALFVDITLFVDIRDAAAKDDIEATISYTNVHTAVRAWVEARSWDLIEAVAEFVAKSIIDAFDVKGVHLVVKKPSALHERMVEYTAVEVTRMAS